MSKETDNKVASLEKQVEEMQNAIRRMAQENNNLLNMVSKISQDLSEVKAFTDFLKKQEEDKKKGFDKKPLGVTRY